MHYHGLTVVICKLVVRLTRTPLVSAYLPPLTCKHLPDIEEALKRFKEPIVLGEINVHLDEARSLLIQQVENLLAEYGIIDLVRHFRQCCRFRNLKTWYPDLVPSPGTKSSGS